MKNGICKNCGCHHSLWHQIGSKQSRYCSFLKLAFFASTKMKKKLKTFSSVVTDSARFRYHECATGFFHGQDKGKPFQVLHRALLLHTPDHNWKKQAWNFKPTVTNRSGNWAPIIEKQFRQHTVFNNKTPQKNRENSNTEHKKNYGKAHNWRHITLYNHTIQQRKYHAVQSPAAIPQSKLASI